MTRSRVERSLTCSKKGGGKQRGEWRGERRSKWTRSGRYVPSVRHVAAVRLSFRHFPSYSRPCAFSPRSMLARFPRGARAARRGGIDAVVLSRSFGVLVFQRPLSTARLSRFSAPCSLTFVLGSPNEMNFHFFAGYFLFIYLFIFLNNQLQHSY